VAPTTNPPARPQQALPELFTPIRAELAEVEQLLQRELHSEWPFVDELVRYGWLLGGKRLRPALLLLAGKATGTLCPDHTVLAAVVEMIHTATLVHDDVLDEAELRRHLATVNSRWDTDTSVLLGDYLFTHAFYLASTLESTYACRTIGRATNTVCEGELRQVHGRGDFAMTEEQYLSIIQAKTAELCACCCHLGAHAAGADPATVQRLGQYGRWLGIAFQISDDLLDLVGDESTMGKSLGTDLQKRKPTLPLIHVFQQCSGRERAALESLLTAPLAEQREALPWWFERFGALEYGRAKAEQYGQRARQSLEGLAPNLARDVLAELPSFVVTRTR